MDPTTPNYEFSSSENEEIAGLVGHMSLFSWALLLGGPLMAGLGFFADALLRVVTAQSSTHFTPAFMMLFLAGMVVTILGLWLRKAHKEFKSIVTTEGSDVSHLMTALRQLRRFFRFAGALAWTFILILFLTLGWYAVNPPGPGQETNSATSEGT